MTKLAGHVQEASDQAAEHLRRALYPALKMMGNTTPAWLREKVLPEYDRCGVPRPFIWRREWTDDKRDEWVRRGKAGAQAFFDHTAPAYDTWAELTNVVEGINEFVVWTVEDMRWLNEFDAESALLWHSRGKRYVGGNWSVGHPDLALWVEYKDALRYMDFLGEHIYGWPEGKAEDGVPFLWHPWRVFRYQMVRQTILANQMRLPPLLLTEVGWARGVWSGDQGDVGFKVAPDPNAYHNWLISLDAKICADADVKAAAIFQTGAKTDWQTFDIVGHQVGNTIADYVRLNQLHPAIPIKDAEAFSSAERESAGAAFATLPATMKECNSRGWVFCKEWRRPDFVFCLAFAPEDMRYNVLKMECETWKVVAEARL